MRIAITGSTGMIGSALVQALRWGGHDVVRLVRHDPVSPDQRRYDPSERRIASAGLEDVDAVVNLAGAPIAGGRWTAGRKRDILDSRISVTETIAQNLPADGRCRRFVSGSAIGFYGETGERKVDESEGPGTGFLADVVRAWEAAAASAVPTVLARTGQVMTPRGGFIGKQLPLFWLGLGGRMGDGSQFISWISLEDEVAALVHLLTSSVTGPVDLTAPEPVTNRRFTAALGAALRRPTLLPVPMPVLRVVLGNELVDEAILGSQRALPTRLLEDGFVFGDTEIESTLKRLFG